MDLGPNSCHLCLPGAPARFQGGAAVLAAPPLATSLMYGVNVNPLHD